MTSRYELDYEFVTKSGLIDKFEEFKRIMNFSASRVTISNYSEFKKCPFAKSIRFTLKNYDDDLSGYENATNKVQNACDHLEITLRPRFNHNFKA